jgi:hypothetical protein
VCQFASLRGFANTNPGRHLEINPTLIASLSSSREALDSPGFSAQEEDFDPGLTTNWGITPNLSLGATINPDFSQVEADVAQLNVNNPFELFFEETRPFFLEGADLFDTPLRIIHSRTIADPDFGLRLTGKQGPHGIGLFTARDAKTNFILPGSQFSIATNLDQESTATALRYRYDLGERSVIGVLATDRQGKGYSNRVAGADALLLLSKSNNIRLQILGSRTRYPQQLIDQVKHDVGLQLPDEEIEDLAYGISYSHQSRGWLVSARHIDTGESFRADLGFIPTVDRRNLDFEVERTWWGETGSRWSKMSLGAEWNREKDHAGQELRQGYKSIYRFEGPWQSSGAFSYERRNRFFSGQMFEENERQAFFSMVPSGSFSLSLFVTEGNNIDFVNVQAGDSLHVETAVGLDLGQHFRAQLSHTFDRPDVAAGRLFTADLVESRLIYQVNTRAFVRLITQYTDIRRDPTLYPSGYADRRPKEFLLNQLLFSYTINPRTVLFLGYSDNHLATKRIDLTQQNRALFLKIGYAWVL